jgi:twitching motility two-component system response regulator PilG
MPLLDVVAEAPTAPPPAPADAPLRLVVKGFSAIELRLLDAVVKLSQRRQPRLEIVADVAASTADVVMIDGRDPAARRWAGAQSFAGRTVIWIDAENAPPGHVRARRPVQWPSLPMMLARALEQSPPLALAAGAPRTGRGAIVEPLAASPTPQVLIVDDSLAVRAYLRSQLEGRGLVVADAASAEAGIAAALAASPPFRCILMDVLMPGIDGYEACRRIKAQLPGSRAPAVLMLTSRSSPFDRIRAKMAGCDAYLTKPVDPGQLHDAIARQLDTAAARHRPKAAA